MDPNDPDDIANFERLLNETEIPHFDYRNRGYEAHDRKIDTRLPSMMTCQMPRQAV